MNITLKFESTITTEETYPHSFKVTFERELQIDEYADENELLKIIFNKAYEFEHIITKGLKVVDTMTEIKGITFIHDIKSWQPLDLARLGIERI